MKYIAILAGILILTGAGCNNQSTVNDNGNATNKGSDVASTNVDIETMEGKNTLAGFHIYSPTFIPADAPLEGGVAVTQGHAVWTLTKDSFNSKFPSVDIEENPAGAADGVMAKLAPKLTSTETVTVNGASGIYGVENNVYDYNTIIFTTTDGVEISVVSRYYSKDVLMQIAQGMK